MKQPKPKMPKLVYFFYNGDLHKKIHINRGDDLVTAWNYPKNKMVKYVYSDVRKNGQKAFNTKEVAKMVDRTWRSLLGAIYKGDIKRPQIAYSLDETRREYAYYWREEDIMELHAHLKTVHYGRPRNDGRVTPKELPSSTELRSMIRQGTVFYVKDGDDFVPTWRANNH